ncbi:MAG: GGDEF domain-containing protein [Acetatifactor sp.]|nr:GGDEF domain-containing protein [Acetatifactor sp.]
MKKRIAVFANGWGTEYLRKVVTGAYAVAKDANADIFAFVNFSTFSEFTSGINNSEFNIFQLPDLKDFDGAIIMANSFNMKEEISFVHQIVKESKIPAVSLEYELEGITTIQTDNYSGMYELAKHIVQEHGARRIVYIGGPKEHLESNERLRAVQDVASENGFSIREEDILYGDWAKDLCAKLADEWIHQHNGLPDAFICANDVMAAGICDSLIKQGYKVPDDVMITGYDCIKLGRDHVPPIASVSHEWNSMGIKAVQILLDKMEGRDCEDTITMETKFVSGGSCGCDYSTVKTAELSDYYIAEIDGLACDSHFRHIYLATKKVENADDLYRSCSIVFRDGAWLVGSDFMLCLDQEFFHIEENDENLRTQGYSDSMDVIRSINIDVPRSHQIMNRKEAMFRVSNEDSKSHIFIFVPVYNEDRSYGFAMLSRDMNIVENNYLYIWTRHMNQCLEQIRRNIRIADLTRKLTKLSVTDVLTGLYNRAGYEKIACPMLEKLHEAGGTGAIMIADIDRMKTINDQYGHASGDLALRTAAAVLKGRLPKDWVICRYGGDEFFAGGALEEGMDLEEVRNSISQGLAMEVEKRQIAFDLGLSIGVAKLEPDEEINFENALRQADQSMYAIKKEHHREIDSK